MKKTLFLIILIVIAVLAYRHSKSDDKVQPQEKTSVSAASSSGRTKTAAPTESPTVTPEKTPDFTPAKTPEESSEYPSFIPEGALVIDGTEESRNYDYLVQKAFDDRVPDFWLKNHRFFGTMDFKELNCGCFWVDTMRHSDYEYKNPDGSVDTYQHLYFTYYDYSEDELNRMKAELENAAYGFLSNVPAGADKWQTIKSVHDQLCASVSYDHSLSQPHIYDAYGAIVLHKAVCAGYSSAFNYILRLSNIPSESSYSDSHAWTHIWLWSPESYADVTWDDTDLTDCYGRPYISYDYFLISYDDLRKVDSHTFISEEKSYFDSNYGDTPLYNNYYTHEGYMMYSYDEYAIIDALRRQMDSNYLTIRFANESDYLRAKNWNSDMMNWILREVGYFGSYYYWWNDAMRTFSFGLYADI